MTRSRRASQALALEGARDHGIRVGAASPSRGKDKLLTSSG